MNLIKADLYKIFHSMSFYIIFFVMTVCAVLFAFSSYALEAGIVGPEVIATAAGLMDTMMITILGPILAATFICSDFQNKSIHNSILYGNGRKGIVWAKLVTYTLTTFIILIPYAVVTLIGFMSGGKFSVLFSKSVDSAYMTILANENGIDNTGSVVVKLIGVLVVIALVHASRLTLCMMLAYILRKPIPVIAGGIVVQLGLSLVAVAFAGSEVMQRVIGWTPFTIMQGLNLGTDVGTIIKTAGMSLVFMAMVTNITAGVFSVAEVK